MENLQFKLRKKQELTIHDECNDFYGFEIVEFLQFNYDGHGNAIVFADGEVRKADLETVNHVLFSGWYDRISLQTGINGTLFSYTKLSIL